MNEPRRSVEAIDDGQHDPRANAPLAFVARESRRALFQIMQGMRMRRDRRAVVQPTRSPPPCERR
jgi:hypothetical protein